MPAGRIRRAGISAVLLLAAVTDSPGETPGITFDADVRPALVHRCGACHTSASAQQGLRVDTVAALLRGGQSGPAVIPGDPDSSLVVLQVTGEDPAMPPVGEPLEPSAVAALKAWIEAGAMAGAESSEVAASPGWWSLQPWLKAAPPQTSKRWTRGPIDAFVLAALRSKGLAPSPEASRRELIRRLAYDLTGLPPSAEQVRAFEQDTRPASYERLVDRLLASPAYGERWGRHWLDVARFGESNGYEQNHLRNNAWPYRDWAIGAFNQDKPFNRMIVEQLAGDQISDGNLDVEAATGFLVAGPHDTVGIKNPAGEAQKRANHLDDIVMATASAFLGLTVHCARCHDHKFDPIPNEDYYRLQAVFAGVWHGSRIWEESERLATFRDAATGYREDAERHEAAMASLREGVQGRLVSERDRILGSFRPSVDQRGTEESFPPIDTRFVRLSVTASTGGRNAVELDELSAWTAGPRSHNVALSSVVTASSTRVDSARPDTYSPGNLVDGQFDKRWISAAGLPAWVQIELPAVVRIHKVEWSSDKLGGFGGRYVRPQPEEYSVEVSMDGRAWTSVATSKGRLPFSEQDRERLLLNAVLNPEDRLRYARHEEARDRARRQLARLPKPRTAFAGKFQQPAGPTRVMVRGDPMNQGAPVVPGSLNALTGLLEGFELPEDAPEGERRLALARWIGADQNALTARVIVNRIWMHHFGSAIVRNPSDFGINGGEPTHPQLLDWLAARLVRHHRWRLKPLHQEIVLSSAYRQSSSFRSEAAALDRDNAYLWRFSPRRLSAEEVRDSVLAASGSLDRRMGGPGFRLYRYTVDNVATYYPSEEVSQPSHRRSVYHQHARSVRPGLLGEFDCPDSSLPAPRRISTTTPLQALALLNGGFSIDQSNRLADRAQEISGANPDRAIAEAWRLVLGRDATEEELARSKSLVSEHGAESLARALFNSNEFLYVF